MSIHPSDNLPEFIELESYERGFAAHYNNFIKPALLGIEEKRLGYLATFNKRLVLAVPIVIVLAGIALALEVKFPNDELTFLKLAAIPGFGLFMWVTDPVRKYKSHVKGKILPAVCDFFGTFKYSEHGNPDYMMFESSGILPNFSSANCEDLIRGVYEDVPIEMQEIKLIQGRGKKKRTVYKGVFYIAEFNKKFTGRTYVKRDQGKLWNWAGTIGNDLERVHLEDPEFEELFEVFATNQIEARFLLTTSFMERLKDLVELTVQGRKVAGVKASFLDNKMYIALNITKNLFEPGSINKSILDVEDLHVFLAQTHAFFEIVRTLKLNEKISLVQ